MGAKLKIILDCSKEFDDPSKIRELMDNLMNVFQKNNWEFSRDKAILTVIYPIEEEFANDLSAISFLEILENNDIRLKNLNKFFIFNKGNE